MREIYKYLPIMAALTFASAVSAQVDPHAGHHPQQAAVPVAIPDQKASNAQPAPPAMPDTMMDRAIKAKKPAERRQLMIENMAMMNAKMAEMKAMMKMDGMMAGKPMSMPMDPSHMEKMQQHMALMHQMMERLMVQQQLMMPTR